uniref:Uncharacterized protein n=1 Tax=Salix viminalis TaxID=40686 RepID=A0A6N2NI55_SALVM
MAGILHKIEGAFGGKKEEQGKGEPHAGQQGHNPQGGGYGQARAAGPQPARRATTRKVATGNKGTTHKVSARKGLLTSSRTRFRGWAVLAVLVAEEKRRRRTRRTERRNLMVAIAAAVTATKHVSVGVPCLGRDGCK